MNRYSLVQMKVVIMEQLKYTHYVVAIQKLWDLHTYGNYTRYKDHMHGKHFNLFFSNLMNGMKVVSLMVSSKVCVVYKLYIHNTQ